MSVVHVAVLMGGWSAEREISLVSGRACAEALSRRQYRVSAIDAGRDVAARLAELEPDVAFNALHGRWGEDGCVQGLLEVIGLPYTHSGVLASALAMNKPAAKHVFAEAGLPCAASVVATREAVVAGHVLEPPYVVKPLAEGSSVGVRIVREGGNAPADMTDWDFGAEVMIERYVPGREITVAVMDGEPLAALEIVPDTGAFYDWNAKYAPGGSRHIVPAPIAAPAYDEAMRIAAEAHRALGCRGVTRADLRYDDTEGEPGRLYLLEVNTQPGMTPTSLVPEIAAWRGISFDDLVAWMVEDAACPR
jgi:D-alanine-D-alanine ligase